MKKLVYTDCVFLFKASELEAIIESKQNDNYFLRIKDSETSIIADVFTQKSGKISFIAKGAKKPKSKFFGYLVPFQKLK